MYSKELEELISGALTILIPLDDVSLFHTSMLF